MSKLQMPNNYTTRAKTQTTEQPQQNNEESDTKRRYYP